MHTLQPGSTPYFDEARTRALQRAAQPTQDLLAEAEEHAARALTPSTGRIQEVVS